MNAQFRNLLVFALFLILLVGAGIALALKTAPAAASGEQTLYTCGMHPQVVQPNPGNCPICGMKLTPIRKQAGAAGATNTTEAVSSGIVVDPATTQTMGIRTALVSRGPLRRTIRTVGTIDYNETTLTEVSIKFRGWIEKLYANSTGQLVMKGDPLFEIYSPELYTAQTEYLLALKQDTNSPGSASLLASALTKLKFFDISDEQIAELKHTGQPRKTLRISAPQDGFVVEKMVVDGQMVDSGMKIFRLADLGLVWVQAQIYEQDLGYLKLGQPANVTLGSLPDREFRGRVTYLYPSVDEKTRTGRVRMEFHNPGYFLKPGMFATVQVTSELEPAVLLVPGMAVLRSGEQATVFVALEGGRFEPRVVKLGEQAENDNYQVLSGLNEGERVVTSGQFMLDSESQLREAIQKMLKPGESLTNAAPSSTNAAVTMNNAAPGADTNDVRYICPMPGHVSIEYNHPGKCAICGMLLVPVNSATLRKLQPGGKLLYYTCPMPEHSDVHEDKPGKCPKCGMTLIPVMESAPPPAARVNPPDIPAQLYTCPMAAHADVVTDKPGKCSKCEMDLVPTSTVEHGRIAEDNWRKQHPAARDRQN